MATLKRYDLKGDEIDAVALDDALLESTVNSQLIKDYLVALRANARQWSANTKSRAEVNHSGQKPHPQKGTGKARQGYLGAPQYKGGGRVFGPKPKFVGVLGGGHTRINRKERRAAIRHLLVEKIRVGQLQLLRHEPLATPNTKSVATFLQRRALQGKSVLFVGDSSVDPLFLKSARNLARTQFLSLSDINGYAIAKSQEIVLMDAALDGLLRVLGGTA